MKPELAASVEDLANIAHRRIPRFAFDFLDGGAGNDAGVRRNVEAFQRMLLKPRFLRGLNPRLVNTKTVLFGRTYDQPFGIAPTGANHLMWPGSDLIIGAVAAQANIPVVSSTMASCSMEKLAATAPGNTWFQLYPRHEEAKNAELLARARAASIEVLVVTVDVPTASNRHRDDRNRFGGGSFKLEPRIALDALLHPAWLLAWLREGGFSFENLASQIGQGTGNKVLANSGRQSKSDFGWSDLERLRKLWPGPLVVKGILDAGDARQCMARGVDGIWVSNHGGRQLESAPAALDCLPPIVDAVGSKAKVLFDSGVRSGEDVVKAYAQGADFVFLGRSFLYGAAAGGSAGARRVLDLYIRDVARTLAQIGCASISALNAEWIWSPGATRREPAGAVPRLVYESTEHK